MKRFFQDDPDDQNFLTPEDEDFEEAIQAEFTTFVNTDDFVNVMSMDLAQMQLNQQLLVVATDLARRGDWLWCFRSTKHQEEKIERFYLKLLNISERASQIVDPDVSEGEEKDADL